MFNFFRKKTQLEQLIAKDGIEHATDRFSEIIIRKLPTKEIAYQFILEEIESASIGNKTAKAFADNSGIPASEYKGSLDNSTPEVDGADGPQQLLLGTAIQLSNNPDLMVEFRCKIDEKIMKKYGFGKYSSTLSSQNDMAREAGTSAGKTEAWTDILSSWADNIGLEELRWEKQPRNRDGGFWVGFPRNPKKMISLEGLNIQNMGLTELPKEIGNLKNLKKLWAMGNKITTIPKEIGNLTLLEEIDLAENEIEAIPDEIGNLKNLLILDLKENKISYVPESISKLRKLQKLDLRAQPINLGYADTPLTDSQVEAIVSLGDVVRW